MISLLNQIFNQDPNYLALDDLDIKLTYADLKNRVILRSKDLPFNKRVALVTGRSIDFVIDLLSIWYNNNSVILIDHKNSSHKILDMLRMTKCNLAVGFDYKDEIVDEKLESEGWIVFTSGSSSFPKAAVLPMHSLQRVISDQIKIMGTEKADRCGWILSPGFDASLSDIFIPLLIGATLVIKKDDDNILPWLFESNVSQIDLPPVYFRLIPPESLPSSLKKIIWGGEFPDIEALKNHSKYRHIVSSYGPSETCISTNMLICSPKMQLGELGSSIGGSFLKIEKEEILIAGDNLLLGYIGRPDPCKMIDGVRYYPSGDKALIVDDKILLKGRLDDEIKIKGKRVYLKEIEQAFYSFKNLKEVFITKSPYRAIVSGDFNIKDLYIHLEKTIDVRVIPLIEKREIERSLNGKAIAKTKIELLFQKFIPSLDFNKSFFSQGGDSLMVVDLLIEAEKLGIDLNPEFLFSDLPLSKIEKVNTKSALSLEKIAPKIKRKLFMTSLHKKQDVVFGANGFLGSFIAKNMDKKTILGVRANSRLSLIKKTESAHFKINTPKLILDPSKKNLGLSFEQYKKLAKSTKTIYNCTGMMHLFKSLNEMSDNFNAVKNIVQFALDSSARLVHISTLSVLVDGDVKISGNFKKGQPVELFGGYAQSKFLAEKIIQKNMSRKSYSIERIGLIFSKSLPNSQLLDFINFIKDEDVFPIALQNERIDVTFLEDVMSSIFDGNFGIKHVSSGSVRFYDLVNILKVDPKWSDNFNEHSSYSYKLGKPSFKNTDIFKGKDFSGKKIDLEKLANILSLYKS